MLLKSNSRQRGRRQVVPSVATSEILCAANPDHAGTWYHLTDHVFACATRHGAVLLDLQRNRYYGLNLADAVSLVDVVSDWPVKRLNDLGTPRCDSDPSRSKSLVQSLLEANVLQRSLPSGCGIGRSTFRLEADLASVGDEIVAKTQVRPAHVATFLLSLLCAFVSLRFLPLNATVRAVHKRRKRAIAKGYIFDADRAAQLTFIFRRLRPYVFSANGHCMIHALSLVNFMAINGQFPYWVLGVRTEPWGAHSWVQHENLLLDTNPAKVCPYNPLLSV